MLAENEGASSSMVRLFTASRITDPVSASGLQDQEAGLYEFKTIAIFCCLGLLLSLVFAMSYGLDLAAF